MAFRGRLLLLIGVVIQLSFISSNIVQDVYVCPKRRPTDCSKFKGGPVCSHESQIRCIRAPCMQEFMNACEACANQYVTSIVCGKCSDTTTLTSKYKDIPNTLKLPLCLPIKTKPTHPIKCIK